MRHILAVEDDVMLNSGCAITLNWMDIKPYPLMMGQQLWKK